MDCTFASTSNRRASSATSTTRTPACGEVVLELVEGSFAGVSKPWRLGMRAAQSSGTGAADDADEFALELAQQQEAMPAPARAAHAPQPMVREPQLARLLLCVQRRRR